MGPSTEAARLPLHVGEDGRGSGHLAFALNDAWTSSRSADIVHLKFEYSLHSWHWRPRPFPEFRHSYRRKRELTSVLFPLFKSQVFVLDDSKFSWNMICSTLGRNTLTPLPDYDP